MDNPPRPEDGHTNPGDSEPASTKEAEILTALDNVRYLKEKDCHENASISNLYGSADAREPKYSTLRGCDSICGSVLSQGPNFSPFVEDSRGFNSFGTSQNHSDSYGEAIFSSDPTHNLKRNVSNCIFISETDPNPKISKSEIFGECGENLSSYSLQDMNYSKPLGLSETSQMEFHNRAEAGIDGLYIESHYDLSRIARNDTELCNMSHVVASNSFFYSEEDCARSGSSCCHKDEKTPNVVGKMAQASNKGEEIKALICRICRDAIAQHETDVLRCVDSLYYDLEGTNLRLHMSAHVPKTTCNICGKEHAVGNWHNSEPEHQCPDPFCMMTFQCRTQFYQHISAHRIHFNKQCWVCIRTFEEHMTEDILQPFACCVCGFPSKCPRSLRNHYQLHLPRSFCNFCRKEYHVDNNDLHGGEFKCLMCNNIFQCRIHLEEHFEGHVKYFSDLCRKSTSNGDDPSYQCPFRDGFETSCALTFKQHLYEHADLIFFECETCGKRFFQINGLNRHTPACKALPYKCEICETRFHTIDLLLSHGLVKHLG